MTLSYPDFAVRVAVALLLGSVIGFERQWRQRMAGLRTNALVATGTSLFVMITPLVGEQTARTQIAAYVVSGIGFLAGGVIFKERLSVSGLNTAATLWCTAAIGALVGLGFLWDAAIGAAAVLAANVLLRPIARRINREPIVGTDLTVFYDVDLTCASRNENQLRALLLRSLEETGMGLRSLASRDLGAEQVQVSARLSARERADERVERVVGRLSLEPAVTAASWHTSVTAVEEEQPAEAPADA